MRNWHLPPTVVCGGLLVIAGFVVGQPWLIVAGLVILATAALLPGASVFAFWPIGLICVVVLQYGGFWLFWYRKPPGISRAWPITTYILLTVALGLIAILRRPRTRGMRARSETLFNVAVALPGLYLLQFGARQSTSSAKEFLGNFVFGGDHSLHAELAFKFTHWSAYHDFNSPFTIYAYPSGLHFFSANVAEFKGAAGYSPAARTYLETGRLNWVFFAAFVQLSMLALTMFTRSHRLFRWAVALSSLVLIASIPNLAFHLFLAGFMTSLGVTVVLLALFVVLTTRPFDDIEKFGDATEIAILAILTYAAAITYQPYTVIPLAIFIARVVGIGAGRLLPEHARLCRLLMGRSPTGLLGAILGLVPLIVYNVRGSESPSIRSLLVPGATMTVKPELAFLTAFVAGLFVWQAKRSHVAGERSVAAVVALFSLISFTGSLVWIVARIGNLGVQQQPYYTQKAMWTMLLSTIPIAIGAGLALFAAAIANKGRVVFPTLVGLPICIALIPWALSYSPDAGLSNIRNPRIQWFIPSYMESARVNESSIAFTTEDPLGSHVANLALHLVSRLRVPAELSLNADPVAACLWISTNPVRRVYTSPGGYDILMKSGCPTTGVRYFGGR